MLPCWRWPRGRAAAPPANPSIRLILLQRLPLRGRLTACCHSCWRLPCLNLALGYAAAAALVDPPFWKSWRLPALRRKTRGAAAVPRGRLPQLPHAPAPARCASCCRACRARAPPSRAGRIATRSGSINWRLPASSPKSFLEAAAQVLRLEVGRYREQLVGHRNRAAGRCWRRPTAPA